MSDTAFRFGKKRFYDDNHFPKGFSKSGDFTLAEAELLTNYGDTMRALESGELLPENSEEKHFVKILAHPNKANSKIERTWLKYIQLTRGGRKFHTLNSKRVSAPSEELLTDDDLDFVDEA